MGRSELETYSFILTRSLLGLVPHVETGCLCTDLLDWGLLVLLFPALPCRIACKNGIATRGPERPRRAGSHPRRIARGPIYPESSMSVSSVPSNINAQQAGAAQNIAAQARQDLKGLKSARQSGDISGAGNDFSAFMKLLQGIQQTGQSSTSHNSAQNTIASATQSVSSSSAQDAIDQLLKELQLAAQGRHHHHHDHGAQPASNSANSAPAGSATAGSGSGGISIKGAA